MSGNHFMTERAKNQLSKRKRANVIESYQKYLSMPADRFNQIVDTPATANTLDLIVLKSIKLAIADPESGEAHRIMNRVWGRPAETKLHLHKVDDPSESALAKQIASLRGLGKPKDVEVVIVKEEEKKILEAADAQSEAT